MVQGKLQVFMCITMQLFFNSLPAAVLQTLSRPLLYTLLSNFNRHRFNQRLLEGRLDFKAIKTTAQTPQHLLFTDRDAIALCFAGQQFTAAIIR